MSFKIGDVVEVEVANGVFDDFPCRLVGRIKAIPGTRTNLYCVSVHLPGTGDYIDIESSTDGLRPGPPARNA